MSMWRKECVCDGVCAMVCVWAWETDCRSKMHSITVWKQPWGVAGQAEGGWEVTCFRRLSLNMRAQILTFMSGSTHQCVSVPEELPFCILPWSLIFMTKRYEKKNTFKNISCYWTKRGEEKSLNPHHAASSLYLPLLSQLYIYHPFLMLIVIE